MTWPDSGPDSELKKMSMELQPRVMSLAMKFGLMAADEAVEDAGWRGSDLGEDQRARTGVSVGMAIPDLEYIAACDELVSSGKSKKMGPYFVPREAFRYYLTILIIKGDFLNYV